MALKYRIDYGSYSRYKKCNLRNRFRLYVPLLLICAVLVFYYFYSPSDANICEVILPGDPIVTTDAFQRLYNALSRGEALTDALDVFCKTVMEYQ